jgi:hypothetical protein
MIKLVGLYQGSEAYFKGLIFNKCRVSLDLVYDKMRGDQAPLKLDRLSGRFLPERIGTNHETIAWGAHTRENLLRMLIDGSINGR